MEAVNGPLLLTAVPVIAPAELKLPTFTAPLNTPTVAVKGPTELTLAPVIAPALVKAPTDINELITAVELVRLPVVESPPTAARLATVDD